MAPQPLGLASKHVLASRGPDVNTSHFYVTEYSTNHGREKYYPRVGKHTGTGYLSNFRPGLYYSRKLDELDNPVVGKILKDNYQSSHDTQFRPYNGSNGKDEFSKQYHMKKTGFIRDVPQTLPSNHKVRTACYDPTYDHHRKVTRPLLYQLVNPVDPFSQENDSYGPALMSTETRSQFVPSNPTFVDNSTKTIGYKHDSGFSRGNNEPITYRPSGNYKFHSGMISDRPIGHSIMKGSFQPIDHEDGKSSFRQLTKRAERETGYTREITSKPRYIGGTTNKYTKLNDLHPMRLKEVQKTDPVEVLNMKYADRFPSMTPSTFQGVQRNITQQLDTTRCASLITRKEETGFTENNLFEVQPRDTPRRFTTQYDIRYDNKNPKGLERKCNALRQMSNGFTKSTQVHEEKKKQESLTLHPYTARSIEARDPRFRPVSLRAGCSTY